jgi:hypothetical protein
MPDIIDNRTTKLAERIRHYLLLSRQAHFAVGYFREHNSRLAWCRDFRAEMLTSRAYVPILITRNLRGALLGFTQYAAEPFGARMIPPGTLN